MKLHHGLVPKLHQGCTLNNWPEIHKSTVAGPPHICWANPSGSVRRHKGPHQTAGAVLQTTLKKSRISAFILCTKRWQRSKSNFRHLIYFLASDGVRRALLHEPKICFYVCTQLLMDGLCSVLWSNPDFHFITSLCSNVRNWHLDVHKTDGGWGCIQTLLKTWSSSFDFIVSIADMKQQIVSNLSCREWGNTWSYIPLI